MFLISPFSVDTTIQLSDRLFLNVKKEVGQPPVTSILFGSNTGVEECPPLYRRDAMNLGRSSRPLFLMTMRGIMSLPHVL